MKPGAWKTWLMIGATGFGGPAGQVAILHREVVERHKWLDEEEFLAAMRLCMLLPGPEAQQLATYAGWRQGGVAGGLLAGTLFVIPGALLVTALAWLHAAGEHLPLVAAAFAGTRPAVVALVSLAAWRIGRKSLRSPAAVVIAIGALAALAAGASFPLVVLVAGIVGFLLPFDLAPRAGGKDAHAGRAEPAMPAEPADTAPARGRSPIHHAVITAAVWTAIWGAAYLVVSLLHLAGGRGADIAALFTETTLLSLGGAYAVVPWALDESVARGWLAPAERFDALAMGEATPGPLILVVTFIGFLAGWKTDTAGAAAAGLEGAAIATLFAFIPSFAMVFALAPLVRSIRPTSGLGRAMTAIGAAVVAAIVLLGLKLAFASFLPEGQLSLLPIAVAIVSAVALLRGWASTPVVVAAAAAVGALLQAIF
ncbi:MAG: chromate efflux transporter [Planctomycetia bacterium]|nr:chromate efflux transporter [Planctomycetia bacterium]